MKKGKLYLSKKNGRIYKCICKSDYEPIYSILPLNPTEFEKNIYPFPHLRVEYNPDDWEEVSEKNTKKQATIDELENIDGIYIVKNNPV